MTEAASPLSCSQLGVWLTEQLYGDAGLTIWTRLEREAPLSAERLRTALEVVADRQGVLRTVFADTDGWPTQTVLDRTEPDLTVSSDPAAPAAFLARGFDPQSRPPWRALLHQPAGEPTAVYLAAHHLVFDDVSKQLWVAEVEAALDGSVAPLLEIDYLDYVAWQRDEFGSSPLEVAEAWRSRLDLAGERRATGDRGSLARYDRLPLAITPAVASRLARTAQDAGVSVFAVVCALVAQVVGDRRGETRPVLGTVVEGRDLLELRPLIGCFTDVGLVAPTDDLSFDLAQDAVTYARAAEFLLAHPVPLTRLVEELRPATAPRRTPFATVGVQLMHAESVSSDVAEPNRPAPRTPFGMEFSFVSAPGGGLTGELLFRADWFTAAELTDLVAAFGRLGAEPAARAPATPAAVVEDAPVPASVLAAVDHWADQTPDRVAAVAGATRLTYAELRQAAVRLADGLAAHGVGAGDRVAVHLDRDRHLLPTVLAIWSRGASYVPIDRDLPLVRKQRMRALAGARVVVSTDADAAAWPGTTVLGPDRTEDDPTSSRRLGDAAGPGVEAYVMFTSGSSGLPKGVQVGHASLLPVLLAVTEQVGLTSASRVLGLTSISFDISLIELVGALVRGAEVVLVPDQLHQLVDDVIDLAVASRPTHLQATPAMWRLLVGGAPDLDVVALCGGDVLPPDLAGALAARFEAVWNLYGPTEATIWASVDRVTGAPRSGPVIGGPLPTAEFAVRDDSGRPVAAGEVGELWIGGVCVALGYLDDPERTGDRFVSDHAGRWYRTGDQVSREPDGRFRFLGRTDGQVKIRGFRVELTEIEGALRSHPDVVDAGVVHDREADRLVALLSVTGTVSGSELAGRLREQLPHYMVPSAFFGVDRLPWTANAKLDRQALARLPRDHPLHAETRSRPTSALEERVLRVCREVLAAPEVSLDDDFFAVGGHSLLVVQLASRVRREFEVKLPLRDVFAATSLRQLAARIGSLVGDAGSAAGDTPSPGRRPAIVRQPRE